MSDLTPAQQRLLARVRKDGPLIFNARARRPIKALETAGLVEVDWDMDITSTGSTRWRITVTALPGKEQS